MINGANSSAKKRSAVDISTNNGESSEWMHRTHVRLMMDSKVAGLQNEDGCVSKVGHELIMRLTWLAEMHTWIMHQAY